MQSPYTHASSEKLLRSYNFIVVGGGTSGAVVASRWVFYLSGHGPITRVPQTVSLILAMDRFFLVRGK